MNVVRRQSDFRGIQALDGGLSSLSEMLEIAAREGHPDTCKEIAILMAARVASASQSAFSVTDSPRLSAASELKRRLQLPTIGSARVLIAILESPVVSLTIEEIGQLTGSSYKSTLCFVSQLRSHLRRSGLGDLIEGGLATEIEASRSLRHYVDHWEEVQAIISVVRDRKLFEHILRLRLKLACASSAKLLCRMLLTAEGPVGRSDYVQAAPLDPSGLRMTISRLRQSLRLTGLDRLIETTKPHGKMAKAQYQIAPGKRVEFFEAALAPLMSAPLARQFDLVLEPLVTAQASLRNGHHRAEAAWRRGSKDISEG